MPDVALGESELWTDKAEDSVMDDTGDEGTVISICEGVLKNAVNIWSVYPFEADCREAFIAYPEEDFAAELRSL